MEASWAERRSGGISRAAGTNGNRVVRFRGALLAAASAVFLLLGLFQAALIGILWGIDPHETRRKLGVGE